MHIYLLKVRYMVSYNNTTLRGDYQRLMMDLLSLMAVMLEGLGFNLCVAPFLNVFVLNLSWRVGGGRCQK